MTIFEAMQKTADEAIGSENLYYLYKNDSGYFISRNYYGDWLFKVFPGGKKILSMKGKKLVAKAQSRKKTL